LPTSDMISLLFFSLVAVVVGTSDELLSVSVVIRHAERPGQSGWATPQSPQVFFRGNGQLSDQGIDNACEQGKEFRKRYVKSGFIDKRFLPSEVYVRSSAVNRCLMSAASFSSALFRETSKDHAVIPPIYTKDQKDDGLLVPLLSCSDGWDDVIARFNLTSSVNVQQQALMKMLTTMWPEGCSGVPPTLIDAIVSELPNKLIKMPANYRACVEGPAKPLIYDYAEIGAGAGNNFNELRIKRVAGLLTNELLTSFAAVANCSTVPCPGQPKMRIYYTHDTNVVAIAHVFGVLDSFHNVAPEFSSALVFEIRRNANGAYVKIFLKDGHKADFVDTNNCASDCSLSAVTAAASPLAITSQIPC
ncbi:hypothetical protein PMAYCL1PPCAC_06323, partial [Pristionchus mayeri]